LGTYLRMARATPRRPTDKSASDGVGDSPPCPTFTIVDHAATPPRSARGCRPLLSSRFGNKWAARRSTYALRTGCRKGQAASRPTFSRRAAVGHRARRRRVRSLAGGPVRCGSPGPKPRRTRRLRHKHTLAAAPQAHAAAAPHAHAAAAHKDGRFAHRRVRRDRLGADPTRRFPFGMRMLPSSRSIATPVR
jgi:hypothetical protein